MYLFRLAFLASYFLSGPIVVNDRTDITEVIHVSPEWEPRTVLNS